MAGAVTILALAGCSAPEQARNRIGATDLGSPSATPSTPADPVEVRGSPTLAEIRERGTLLVGVRAESSAFVRRTGGDYAGFDVRVATILAERLGLNPKTQLTFRALPPTLRGDAVRGGSVDLLVGGVDESASGLATVGPYVISGPRLDATRHYLGFAAGDPAFREKLRGALMAAARDGSLQSAMEATLGEAGVRARLPENLPR